MLSIYNFSQILFYENFNGIAGSTAGGSGTYKFADGWNKEVRIAFRNDFSDKFLLLIDDVKVELIAPNDVALTSVLSNVYTKIPISKAEESSFVWYNKKYWKQYFFKD
ncbi:hypothetical protein ACK2M7_07145 [Chryseobacterium sp. TY4]